MPLLRSILSLLVPGSLFIAALYLSFEVEIPSIWQPLLTLFPPLAAVTGWFLGWRFNRSRVLWVIALLAGLERGLALASPLGREYLLLTAQVLVPLNLAMVSWWSERGVLTRHGLLRLVILTGQAGIAGWLFFAAADVVMTWLERPLVAWPVAAKLPFPQVSLLVMALCLVALAGRYVKKPEALEGGFCWVLPAVVAGFYWPAQFSYWAGVAAFILAVAIIESGFRMAFNDELTGLPARRAMNEFLLKVGRQYTIAVVDVDFFKKVNDRYGHDVGDQVLRMVATCLRRVSGGGRAFRYGGEEFVVIFPHKEISRALPHLEELRKTIADSQFTIRGRGRPKRKPANPNRESAGKARFQVTVSIGAASRDDRNTTPEQLIKAADKALYRAKRGGRNQVCH